MLKVEYAYNERGQKIRKTVYTTAAGSEDYEYVMITHYLNDLSGNVMAVYTDTRLITKTPNVHLTELTLYGTGRLGF